MRCETVEAVNFTIFPVSSQSKEAVLETSDATIFFFYFDGAVVIVMSFCSVGVMLSVIRLARVI